MWLNAGHVGSASVTNMSGVVGPPPTNTQILPTNPPPPLFHSSMNFLLHENIAWLIDKLDIKRANITTPSEVMSEYTSTRDGFQQAIEWSLTGPPDEAKAFAEAVSTPDFYQVLNGHRLPYDDYVKHIEEMRAKVVEWKPIV